MIKFLIQLTLQLNQLFILKTKTRSRKLLPTDIFNLYHIFGKIFEKLTLNGIN